jgi:hypothetical protein
MKLRNISEPVVHCGHRLRNSRRSQLNFFVMQWSWSAERLALSRGREALAGTSAQLGRAMAVLGSPWRCVDVAVRRGEPELNAKARRRRDAKKTKRRSISLL